MTETYRYTVGAEIIIPPSRLEAVILETRPGSVLVAVEDGTEEWVKISDIY